MSRRATDFHGCAQERVSASPPLPADHVLNSAAVLFPGAFDLHGCPLVVFPADTQDKLSSELSKAEVVDFIQYFLCLHNQKQEKQRLGSVVADLRNASLPTARVVAETLLLLERNQRTVHSVYIVQPKKKEALKLLLKLLAPSRSFKKVFLREIPELFNHIDRSQLPAALGGYLIYCHRSWVAFTKEIDDFLQAFLSAVRRLPSCISGLQALSRLPPPAAAAAGELRDFCSTNEAKFLQLRRELGLDALLTHCERVVEKLRYPEKEPCYQAMAGTPLFTHTAFDMLQNHSRITAAVEKVELLWQQAFGKPRLQLQVFQLREDALQITEQIKTLLEEKLQPYKIEIAKDAATAVKLVSEFEASVHIPAMALILCAEDVIHTVAEILLLDGQARERWVLDVERLKEKLRAAVDFILQTLRAVSSYHRHYSKAAAWYRLVLSDNVLQLLLSGVEGDGAQRRRNWGAIPAWRYKTSAFLKTSPPPDAEELLHLAHLARAVPDGEVQEAGQRMSQRCMTLRKLLMSSGPVSVGHLQLALHWQYELLRSGNRSADGAATGAPAAARDIVGCEGVRAAAASLVATSATDGKPTSLSSFDSGFDGAGGGQPEAWDACGTGDSRPALVGNAAPASIQIVPRVTADSLNLEIKVTRCSAAAAPPNNPWLSLPVDDLENSYTVTITQNPTPRKKEPRSHEPADPHADRTLEDWTAHSPSGSEDMELSPVRHVLSSTITDGRDKSVCTSEGISTLLWDSYDLHDRDEDAVESEIDLSLNDWHVKEQEDLRAVEKILDRADDILEKEENVLAQEAVLDALLRSEDGRHHHQWPPWDSEDQLAVMSSSELADAGVLGLEDHLDPAWSDALCEPGSASETEASDAFGGRGPDLLVELREVQVLEELIMEENLLIRELRRHEDEDLANEPSSASEEREAFRLRLENEKREVEKLEESLEKERRATRRRGGVITVVKCSAMEKAGGQTEEDRALCDELLSGRGRSRRRPPPSVQNDSQETCGTENPRAATGPDVAKEAADRQDDRWSLVNEAVSDLKEAPEEAGLQPRGCADGNQSDEDASSPSGMRPDVEAFDPGGNSPLPAVDELGVAPLPVNHADLEPPSPPLPPSTQLRDPAQDLDRPENAAPDVGHESVVKEQSCSNNNNNNHALADECDVPLDRSSGTTTRGEEDDASEEPERLIATDLQPAEDVQNLSAAVVPPAPRPPPDRPLEFDPGGGDERSEGFAAAGVQRCEAVRVSGSGSPVFNLNVREMSDFKTPIVLDTGSGLMKAGFADQDLPNIIFPTIIGMPKYEEMMNGNLEREMYIGHEAQHMRGVLALKHPIKNGIIRNWDEMEKIWHHTFQQLRVDPDDHPVLLTEAAMNPLENRQRLVEIMFECFNVPFAYVAMQAVLALYAAGRTTGVVFDSGDGVSHSVPVFEGYCLPHAVQRFPLAGADVTMHLKKLLQERGVSMRTTAELEIVREMKERCCCVAVDYEAELRRRPESCREMHYTMPDGQVVTLDTERFRAPEILFKPELIGRDHYGMHESVFKSVLSSDIDLRRCFLGNIVLSGGNTLLPGLPERLQAEIGGLVPAHTGDSVRVTSPEDRDFSVWRGGAVLANLPAFGAAWISRDEYEEHGPEIVFRKCF